jgi:sortase (surface protein transpeptidase)
LLVKLLRTGAIIAIVLGGVLAYEGIHDSPQARIDRLAQADHQRAARMARRSLVTASRGARVSFTHVAWNPTVPDQVATVSIPALDVSAPVVAEAPVGGELTIPADVHEAGWDEQTPTPGQKGVTLLAGHVNWVGQGEGALGEIGQLVPGDRIVLNWQGRETTWSIATRPRLSPNTVAHPGLFTDRGSPTLALVTCGGPFTEVPGRGGSYADNVIVEASLS